MAKTAKSAKTGKARAKKAVAVKDLAPKSAKSVTGGARKAYDLNPNQISRR